MIETSLIFIGKVITLLVAIGLVALAIAIIGLVFINLKKEAKKIDVEERHKEKGSL